MSGISIMLKIGAKSIHSDVHINQISNFVCQKPLPDRNEATHKISSNWSMLQKYKRTYIVLLWFRDDACKGLKNFAALPQTPTLKLANPWKVYTAL